MNIKSSKTLVSEALNEIKTISVTGNKNSTLAKNSNYFINYILSSACRAWPSRTTCLMNQYSDRNTLKIYEILNMQ